MHYVNNARGSSNGVFMNLNHYRARRVRRPLPMRVACSGEGGWRNSNRCSTLFCILLRDADPRKSRKRWFARTAVGEGGGLVNGPRIKRTRHYRYLNTRGRGGRVRAGTAAVGDGDEKRGREKERKKENGYSRPERVDRRQRRAVA